MGETIYPRIRSLRVEAWPAPPRRDGTVEIPLPESYLKKTHNTLVWSAAAGPGARAFFKMYHHRRLLDWWGRWVARSRAEREYDRLLILHSAGVPCAEPLVCAYGVDAEHGRYEIIGTREISGARQLKACLDDAKAAGRNPNLAPLFETIRRMHAAGIYHGTLTPNNIIVSESPGGASVFHVVDLPRAIDFPFDLRATRMAWYDLVHFVYRTAPFLDVESCLPVLDRYDFQPGARERFLRDLARYRPGKWLRYRLRMEFGWRARVAGGGARPRG